MYASCSIRLLEGGQGDQSEWGSGYGVCNAVCRHNIMLVDVTVWSWHIRMLQGGGLWLFLFPACTPSPSAGVQVLQASEHEHSWLRRTLRPLAASDMMVSFAVADSGGGGDGTSPWAEWPPATLMAVLGHPSDDVGSCQEAMPAGVAVWQLRFQYVLAARTCLSPGPVLAVLPRDPFAGWRGVHRPPPT